MNYEHESTVSKYSNNKYAHENWQSAVNQEDSERESRLRPAWSEFSSLAKWAVSQPASCANIPSSVCPIQSRSKKKKQLFFHQSSGQICPTLKI